MTIKMFILDVKILVRCILVVEETIDNTDYSQILFFFRDLGVRGVSALFTTERRVVKAAHNAKLADVLLNSQEWIRKGTQEERRIEVYCCRSLHWQEA